MHKYDYIRTEVLDLFKDTEMNLDTFQQMHRLNWLLTTCSQSLENKYRGQDSFLTKLYELRSYNQLRKEVYYDKNR